MLPWKIVYKTLILTCILEFETEFSGVVVIANKLHKNIDPGNHQFYARNRT